MEQNDMVKKLHEKANIPEDIARDALVRADWDMLEALLILEKEGKIKPLTSSMTTVEDKSNYEEVRRTASDKSGGRYEKTAQGFFDKLGVLLRSSLTHSFIVERKCEVILSLPVLIMLVITLSMIQFTAAAALIGLFLDCRYSIQKREGK